MKNFLKEHWFKISIVLILVIGMLFAFSLLNKQVRMDQERQTAAFNLDCQKSASDQKKEILKDNSSAINIFFRSYEYTYDQKVSGCILAYVFDATTPPSIFTNGAYEPTREMKIINLTTGEILFNKHPAAGNDSLQAYDEFNALQQQYIASSTPYGTK